MFLFFLPETCQIREDHRGAGAFALVEMRAAKISLAMC